MMVFLLGLLLMQTPPPAATPASPETQVIAVLNERMGDQVSLRFVVNGAIESYSATREGDQITVRIAAVPKAGLSAPIALDPIRSFDLDGGAPFSMRVRVPESWTHEVLRESTSLVLVLRPARSAAKPIATPISVDVPVVTDPSAPAPSPSPTPALARPTDTPPSDTATLYKQLFPSTDDPTGVGANRTDLTSDENWYSNFTWLGLQMKPWVSMSYIDGKTTAVQTGTVTSDSYLVIQPNLGIGLSPQFGGPRGGQWKINYTPRFRRLVDFNLPTLTSHFFDVGVDQPVASFGSIYGNYHFSKGVLETEEVDPGREYGIGLNRVVDTGLQRFTRNSYGFGAHIDFVADTTLDVNVNQTKLEYGNNPDDVAFNFGARAFFDYKTRLLNASLRRSLGEGRFISALFGIHDTPPQKERAQVEGRGYSYGASLEGDIAALITGRLMFGYRTQKSPNAGAGGQDYKDITYGAQLLRELSEDSTFGLSADRKLYLSAFAENGFYVADSLRGDLNTRLPLSVFLRGSLGLQWNNYKASPQQIQNTTTLALREDKIRYWSLGLARSLTQWAFLRFDYTAERRNSNLDRFDIKTRALTFQLGVGFFGKSDKGAQPTW
ncbi:MAG: outer membrane beta-barrel protein [Vicinamibacteria bacterium]